MKVSALIAAAGQGKRMGAKANKQYLMVNNQRILNLTLLQLDKIAQVMELIILVPAVELDFCQKLICDDINLKTPWKLIPGGQERQDSVYAGLAALSSATDYVLVHDGARPLITGELIENVLLKAEKDGAAVLAVPVKDTIKVADSSGVVKYTPERDSLWAIQTPQVFQRELICQAYKESILTGYYGTDDASLVEALGHPVSLVLGSYENIKITTPEDLLLAEEILRRREKCG